MYHQIINQSEFDVKMDKLLFRGDVGEGEGCYAVAVFKDYYQYERFRSKKYPNPFDEAMKVAKSWSAQLRTDSKILYVGVECDGRSDFAVTKITEDYVGRLTVDGFDAEQSFDIFVSVCHMALDTGAVIIGNYQTGKIYADNE